MAGTTTYFPTIRESIEEGAGFSPAVFLRLGNGASLGQGQVSSWRLKVYCRQSVSEDSAVYSSSPHTPTETNADGSVILKTAPVVDGWAPNPQGYTFRPDLDPFNLWNGSGGNTYSLEFEFSPSNNAFTGKAILKCELSIRPKFS